MKEAVEYRVNIFVVGHVMDTWLVLWYYPFHHNIFLVSNSMEHGIPWLLSLPRPTLEPDESIPHIQSYFFNIHFNIIVAFRPVSSKWPSSYFSTKHYAYFSCPTRVTTLKIQDVKKNTILLFKVNNFNSCVCVLKFILHCIASDIAEKFISTLIVFCIFYIFDFPFPSKYLKANT
jgi:hypothetical protein